MIIYKTINLINGKFYVGKDCKNNPDYLGSGLLINKAIKKYGRDSFKKEIIEKCISKEQLNKQENYWIKKLDSTNPKIGYNIAEGGCGGDTFSNNPNKKEIAKAISNRYKDKDFKDRNTIRLRNSYDDNKESIRKKISASLKGKKKSKEHIALIIKNRRNYLGKNNPFFGKHHTEETIEKIRQSNKRRAKK